MTPRPAVALNLDQLVARDSQSRFSRRKVSTVVPECMTALANTAAPWHTLFRASMLLFTFFSSCRTDLRYHHKPRQLLVAACLAIRRSQP